MAPSDARSSSQRGASADGGALEEPAGVEAAGEAGGAVVPDGGGRDLAEVEEGQRKGVGGAAAEVVLPAATS